MVEFMLSSHCLLSILIKYQYSATAPSSNLAFTDPSEMQQTAHLASETEQLINFLSMVAISQFVLHFEMCKKVQIL